VTLTAEQLWHARRDGHALPIPETVPDLDEAYRINQRIVELSADRQVGWKIGSTSEAAQKKLGTSEPGAGPLMEQLCYPDQSNVPVFTTHNPYIEGEFAFTLNDRIETVDANDLESICGCIHNMLPAIEVVGSRFIPGIDGTGRELITADGGANVALVHARPIKLSKNSLLCLKNQSVTAILNDEPVATGSGKNALGDPLKVIQWLLKARAERSLNVRPGDIISTGTCTGLIKVQPGDHVRVEFPELGSVTATFIDAAT